MVSVVPGGGTARHLAARSGSLPSCPSPSLRGRAGAGPRLRARAVARAQELTCISVTDSSDGSVLYKFSDDAHEIAAAMSDQKEAAEPTAEPAAAPTEAPLGSSSEWDGKTAIVIGGGRVGDALCKMGAGTDVLLKRGDAFPPDAPAGPIFVCTRNNDLDGVVDSVPEARRDDLVFLQNGMLEPWLSSRGLQCTQVLVYFAVAKMGEPPLDGKTDLNPEGLTCANGKWAEAVKQRLNAAGLSCEVLPDAEFRASMFEKLIWISAFMLVGAANGGCTVGEVESKHHALLANVIRELENLCVKMVGVTFGEALEARLCAYGRSVAHFPTAVKEFEWRNKFFHDLSAKETKHGAADPAPMHSTLLRTLGVV